ncbi:helix-turn-helix domain-containing protein [Streptomyces sp. NPDC004610]|uniref:PucR family transcriptional regulator n=1 Tax=unclassified Streptomyces TaxID=2593676 RepID=UPI0033BC8E7D
MPPLSLRRLREALPPGTLTLVSEGAPGAVTGAATGIVTEPATATVTATVTGVVTEPATETVTGAATGIATEPATGIVTGVDLLDCPDAARDLPPGLLLLAVGLDPAATTAVEEALRTAARCSAALAVKTALPVAPALLDRARREGVAVVAVDPAVPWSRIQHLVGTLLTRLPAPPGPGGERPGGGDLFALSDALAAIVGGAVAIMDVHQVVVAYSTLPGQPIDDTRRRGILNRQVPEDALADHLDRELWRTDSVVRHHRPGDLPRMAVAIRAGTDVLGSLWVAFPPDGPPGDVEAALREAAGVAALHMLALRRQIDADQDSRNEALRAALDTPRSDEPVGTGAERLPPGVLIGLAEVPPAQGAAPSPDRAGGEDARRRADLLRLLDLVALDGRALGYETAAAVIGGRLYALLPSAPATAVPMAHLLDHLHRRAHRATRRRYALVHTAVSPQSLRTSRHDIDAALDHLYDTGAGPGLHPLDDLRADLVLRRLLRVVGERADLRTGLAERIAAHDAEHGTEFLATVAAYLDHFGEVAPAGAALHIHQNTLRQRLRKAERLFGLTLDDPTRRLLLAVEVAAALRGTPGAPSADGPVN